MQNITININNNVKDYNYNQEKSCQIYMRTVGNAISTEQKLVNFINTLKYTDLSTLNSCFVSGTYKTDLSGLPTEINATLSGSNTAVKVRFTFVVDEEIDTKIIKDLKEVFNKKKFKLDRN